MKTVFHAIVFSVLMLCQACSTTALWQDTDPNRRAWISADSVTEQALKSRGVKYQAYTGELGKGFLVEKSACAKMRDYQLRALGTPVTVVVDAVSGVAVVVAYMFVMDPDGTVELIGGLCK